VTAEMAKQRSRACWARQHCEAGPVALLRGQTICQQYLRFYARADVSYHVSAVAAISFSIALASCFHPS
jgi:hypothetical protein